MPPASMIHLCIQTPCQKILDPPLHAIIIISKVVHACAPKTSGIFYKIQGLPLIRTSFEQYDLPYKYSLASHYNQ